MTQQPLIVDIKRNSLEDGPGIRSVVFFKGCPFRCVFCHNPETQSPYPEVAFASRKCLHCGKCYEICSNHAIDMESEHRVSRDLCMRCGSCAEACPSGALQLIGQAYSIDGLTEILLRDRPYYLHSGGGVTFSGGECTLYPDYLKSILERLKSLDVHVAIETCGHFNYESFCAKILPYVDLIFFDIKFADRELHLKYIGCDNDRVVANLFKLVEDSPNLVHPRIPLVPDITARRDNLEAIVELLIRAGASDVQLLPYNPLGLEMYASLGKDKPLLAESFMSQSDEKRLSEVFEEILAQKRRGLQCKTETLAE